MKFGLQQNPSSHASSSHHTISHALHLGLISTKSHTISSFSNRFVLNFIKYHHPRIISSRICAIFITSLHHFMIFITFSTFLFRIGADLSLFLLFYFGLVQICIIFSHFKLLICGISPNLIILQDFEPHFASLFATDFTF